MAVVYDNSSKRHLDLCKVSTSLFSDIILYSTYRLLPRRSDRPDAEGIFIALLPCSALDPLDLARIRSI